VELAKEEGWRAASLAIQSKHIRNHITDSTRLSILNLVEISNGERVLDLNPGLSLRPAQIAKWHPHVDICVLDSMLDTLLFLDIVKREEGLSNLKLACGDPCNVPAGDESFDLILMTDAEARLGRVGILTEAKRLLRKGGRLVVGTDNRYSYQRVVRKPDLSGLALGRKIAGRQRRPALQGLRGYQTLFQELGFRRTSFYSAIPNCKFPRVISDLDNVGEMIKAAKLKGLGKALRASPSQLLKQIIPSVFIVVEK
jgi:SAM-dependent methyltransferase